jgi:hypothetical protein
MLLLFLTVAQHESENFICFWDGVSFHIVWKWDQNLWIIGYPKLIYSLFCKYSLYIFQVKIW